MLRTAVMTPGSLQQNVSTPSTCYNQQLSSCSLSCMVVIS